MSLSIFTLASGKSYSNQMALGIGNMRVEGTTVYFTIAETEEEVSVTLPTPSPGKDGISIVDVDVNKNNQLICTMSDGSTIVAGEITIDSSKLNLDNYYNKNQSDELYLHKDDIEAITSDEIKALFN